jgi:hypothetical protein
MYIYILQLMCLATETPFRKDSKMSIHPPTLRGPSRHPPRQFLISTDHLLNTCPTRRKLTLVVNPNRFCRIALLKFPHCALL